jgi:hypothetical protein
VGLNCGGEETGDAGWDKKDRAAVEAAVRTFLTSGPEDANAFVGAADDELVRGLTGMGKQDCVAQPYQCIDEHFTRRTAVTVTELSSEEATVIATLGPGKAALTLEKHEGIWVNTRITVVTEAVPSGVKQVILTLNEFDFGFLRNEIPADGEFAFVVQNTGDQYHEVILDRLPRRLDIEGSLRSTDPIAGVGNIAVLEPFAPKSEGNVILEAPLAPGRYGLFCYLPDTESEERTPHALEGMWAEFTVGG